MFDILGRVQRTGPRAPDDSTVNVRYKAQDRREYVQITYLTDGIMGTRTHSTEVSQLSNRKQENGAGDGSVV